MVERGDPFDPVTLDVEVSFAHSVAFSLTAKPVAEESYVLSQRRAARGNQTKVQRIAT
jgi:hypothetical protein